MHSDTHYLLHQVRATELAAEARTAALTRREHRLRAHVGWILVELGLRLAQQAPRTGARLA
ncbi:hypothetical protein [Streptomyces sp. NPDC048361]|uniref:hypothetical protein n=1 Tax=Streptomyces sp. NPDC048361 TaxID=3154720 RepID=UPI003438D642